MTDLNQLGRLLIVLAAFIGALGLLLIVAGRIPFFGRLPGDISFRRGQVTVYAPLVTSLLLSLLLTILLNLFLRR
jgi:hypothetical protein